MEIRTAASLESSFVCVKSLLHQAFFRSTLLPSSLPSLLTVLFLSRPNNLLIRINNIHKRPCTREKQRRMIMTISSARPDRFSIVVLHKIAIGLEDQAAAVRITDNAGLVPACVGRPEDVVAGAVAVGVVLVE